MTERRWSLFSGLFALAVLALGLLACGKTIMPDSTGGETHFLASCQGGCGDGLSCLCGVCTIACEDGAACGGLSDGASCSDADMPGCGEDAPARVCDVTCQDDGDCGELGGQFTCEAGACREVPASVGDGDAGDGDTGDGDGGDGDAGDGDGGDGDAGDGDVAMGDGDGAADDSQPLVMLVLDTSGSMERKPVCDCTTPSCSECLPNCANGDLSRWQALVEALAGHYEDYACALRTRTAENGATYDLGYYLPHLVVRGTFVADGLLSTYGDRLRFGAATFDGWDTYMGTGPLVPFDEFDPSESEDEGGLWSYPPQAMLDGLPPRADGYDPGLFHYPNCETDYRMNTGIRGVAAQDGPLMLPGEGAAAVAVADAITSMMPDVRPYGGTPIAAALDDLYYVFAHDPALADERSRPERERHVVLITDGYPDDDYRAFGCDCTQNVEPDAPGYCGGGAHNSPGVMRCPYPHAWQAARRLRCDDTEDSDGPCEGGPVTAVHVVGLSLNSLEVKTTLNRIAAAGGTGQASLAQDATELRAVLTELFDELLER